MASNVEHDDFHEQAVAKTGKLPVIWDAVI